jgi:hypothetical protein
MNAPREKKIRPAPAKVTKPKSPWDGWRGNWLGLPLKFCDPSFQGEPITELEIKFLGEALTNYRATHKPRTRR